MWNSNKLVEHAKLIVPAFNGEVQEKLVDAIDRSGIDKGDAILQWMFKHQSPAVATPFWEGDLDALDTAIAEKERQYGIERHVVWHDEETFDEDDFEPCDNCDLPDACADFGCAIRHGIKRSTHW